MGLKRRVVWSSDLLKQLSARLMPREAAVECGGTERISKKPVLRFHKPEIPNRYTPKELD